MSDRSLHAVILAVDTTGEQGSIALVYEDGAVQEVRLDSPEGFAHLLFGEIEALLKRAGIDYQDIEVFASASGPGSFTGVRIGLTAVKGLAEATGRPAIAVSNLQALAMFGSTHLRAVVIDARRGEIYGAVYNDTLETVQEEVVMKLDAWLAQLPEGETEFVTLGNTGREAADAIANALPGPVVEAPVALAGAIGRIAWDRLRRGLAQDPAEIDANYVRRSDAEIVVERSEVESPAEGSTTGDQATRLSGTARMDWKEFENCRMPDLSYAEFSSRLLLRIFVPQKRTAKGLIVDDLYSRRTIDRFVASEQAGALIGQQMHALEHQRMG